MKDHRNFTGKLKRKKMEAQHACIITQNIRDTFIICLTLYQDQGGANCRSLDQGGVLLVIKVHEKYNP